VGGSKGMDVCEWLGFVYGLPNTLPPNVPGPGTTVVLQSIAIAKMP
jgi:hypothetical protein